MSNWSAGYVADIAYTYGYYSELSPLRIRLPFLRAGLEFPQIGTACELGFGQGLSVGIHAAASQISWHGTDFNPSQAAFAQNLADVSGSNATLYDQAFADFASRDDLPDFDYIGLHGIWSWISDENRAVIVDFIRRKLKVGGVLYISYNTLPGWSAFAPMRNLMAEHAQVVGSEGRGIVSSIDGAIEFAEKLIDTNPMYTRANPHVAERLKKLKEQNRHYLAHEYFNRDWHPMHFSRMAEWLEPAKVSYACSAHYLDHIDNINLTPAQQTLLGEIPDTMFKESVRDFMVNQQFRRDYWVKGIRKLSPLSQAERFREQKLIMVSYRPDVSLKVTGALGEATMNKEVYDPILDLMADHKIRTVNQILASVQKQGVDFPKLMQAIMVLIGGGHLSPVNDDEVVGKARKHTDKFNLHLLERARGSDEVGFLASPLTGGGVSVNRFYQLFLSAMNQDKKRPEEWAQFTWSTLALQGQKLRIEGRTLETAEENLDELTKRAHEFAEKVLPLLKSLLIA